MGSKQHAPSDTPIPRTDSRQVAEAGMALALAAVLKNFAVWHMPAGGAITIASVAPLWAFARRHGVRAGALAGVCFGVLDLMLHPVVAHWAQAILDYPVAFSTVGLAGLTCVPAAVAMALATAARYAAHVASGVVFFAANAPPGTSALSYSLAYNATYVLPDALLAMALLETIARRTPGILEPARPRADS